MEVRPKIKKFNSSRERNLIYRLAVRIDNTLIPYELCSPQWTFHVLLKRDCRINIHVLQVVGDGADLEKNRAGGQLTNMKPAFYAE